MCRVGKLYDFHRRACQGGVEGWRWGQLGGLSGRGGGMAGGGFWGQLPNEGNRFDSLRGSSVWHWTLDKHGELRFPPGGGLHPTPTFRKRLLYSSIFQRWRLLNHAYRVSTWIGLDCASYCEGHVRRLLKLRMWDLGISPLGLKCANDILWTGLLTLSPLAKVWMVISLLPLTCDFTHTPSHVHTHTRAVWEHTVLAGVICDLLPSFAAISLVLISSRLFPSSLLLMFLPPPPLSPLAPLARIPSSCTFSFSTLTLFPPSLVSRLLFRPARCFSSPPPPFFPLSNGDCLISIINNRRDL